MDIFQRDLVGVGVDAREEEFSSKMLPRIQEAQKIIAKLNSDYHDANETREILEELMHKKLDPSLWLLPPFFTDYGRNITLGKNVFINQGCTFMDRGGIFIGDGCVYRSKGEYHHNQSRYQSLQTHNHLL